MSNAHKHKKDEVITFKVDEDLAEAMTGIRNRSAFIRKAILDALGSTCPVCQGTGILSAAQLEHWRAFSAHHQVVRCDSCNEYRLICEHEHSNTP